MAWKCLTGTMTLCEQLWQRSIPSQAVFCLLVLDPRAAQPTWELKTTPYDQKHLCHPGDTSKLKTFRASRWELHALLWGHSEQCDISVLAELAVRGEETSDSEEATLPSLPRPQGGQGLFHGSA